MRIIIGLAALAASAASTDAALSISYNTGNAGTAAANTAVVPANGNGALARFYTSSGTSYNAALAPPASDIQGNYADPDTRVINPPAGSTAASSYAINTNWIIYYGNTVTSATLRIMTNQYVAQMLYRVGAPGTASVPNPYVCDVCSPNCQLGSTAGTAGTCASFTRDYTLNGLDAGTISNPTINPNRLTVAFYDRSAGSDVSSYSLTYFRRPNPVIVGDPQIVGMQGQDFQVHGIPDEIFNMVSYPTLQVNARFTYLESAECIDNYTACFAHPGTYISEEGFRIGKDKVRVTAGSAKKGLTVSVNGKKTTSNVDLKQGAVEIVNHRRVVVHTNVMKITVTNSDKFFNQELELVDDKLIALGSKRRVLKDNERFHAEVPLHGLQGQTWRNVEYSSGLDYEGTITDYHVVDGNIFGTDFVFNQFSA